MTSDQPGGAPSSLGEGGRSAGSDTARLVALKLCVSLFVLASGFEGISDDDYARIVIAQDFAHLPKLDPSGTSWLPLPFWVTGGVMRLLGTDLAVARAVAVLLGVLSVVAIHRAALMLTDDRRSAFAGAAIAAVLPWSARLGVSAVPELPVAALVLFSLGALARPTSRNVVLGGSFLFAACLSRYEPWLVAPPWAFFVLTASRRELGIFPRIVGAALSVVGPLGWTAWNAHAHGAPFHYIDRVTAYKDAVDQSGVASRAMSYVLATFRAEPELVVVLGFVGYHLVAEKGRAGLVPFLRFRRAAFVVAFLFVALTVLSIRSGAPTHHPERALLVLHLLAALVLGRAAVLVGEQGLLPLRRVLVFLGVMLPAVVILRVWVLYRESFAQRADEVAIGRDVHALVPADERVLVEVVDYGYFAVMAGSGRPWQFERAGDVRPGVRVDPPSPTDLVSQARARGLRFCVGLTPEEAPEHARVSSLRGRYALFEVEGATTEAAP